jgi:hypothetical protein
LAFRTPWVPKLRFVALVTTHVDVIVTVTLKFPVAVRASALLQANRQMKSKAAANDLYIGDSLLLEN